MHTPSCVVVQVACFAVAPSHQDGSLHNFMEDVFKVAPVLASAGEDVLHNVLSPDNPEGPVESGDAEILQLLAKPVTVSKILLSATGQEIVLFV